MSRGPSKGAEGGALSRWSRLKRERAAGQGDAAEPDEPQPAGAVAEPEKSDAEILEELGLPEPESLAKGDDFSAFMAKAVPERLRRRALRRLWLSDPALANLDELIDYGDDFTDAATVVENLQTAWQIGRGFTPEPSAEPAAAVEDGPEEPQGADDVAADETRRDPPPAAGREDAPESLQRAEAPEAQLAGRTTSEAERPLLAPRRRMRFSVPEA